MHMTLEADYAVRIVEVHHDNADGLVFAIICHLGDVPVSRDRKSVV